MTKTYDFVTYKGSQSGEIVQAHGRREIKSGQAVVRITHSGVCGTDAHFVHQDMALGHEGVGVVEVVAPDVKDVKVGDRVGFGYVHWTCGKCQACSRGAYSDVSNCQVSTNIVLIEKNTFLTIETKVPTDLTLYGLLKPSTFSLMISSPSSLAH
jgi:D-arabinose 1-dehydrogenase-like Zn-dependent alcohol dehydrogenase